MTEHQRRAESLMENREELDANLRAGAKTFARDFTETMKSLAEESKPPMEKWEEELREMLVHLRFDTNVARLSNIPKVISNIRELVASVREEERKIVDMERERKVIKSVRQKCANLLRQALKERQTDFEMVADVIENGGK